MKKKLSERRQILALRKELSETTARFVNDLNIFTRELSTLRRENDLLRQEIIIISVDEKKR